MELTALDLNIARCRVLLSAVAMVAVYVDPTTPALMRWLPVSGAPFAIDPYVLAVLLLHLSYSVTVYCVVVRRWVSPARLATVTTCCDVLFGAVIAAFTEGASSPFYAFVIFAVLASGFGSDFRRTIAVTTVSVALYMSLILVSSPEGLNFYLMRPVYLAVTGYLVAFLGQQRLDLEGQIRDLETAMQRQRIARSLHDNYAQALAGITLRLESCCELLRRGEHDGALDELAQLQTGVDREYDDLRAFIYTLTDQTAQPSAFEPRVETQCVVRAEFQGSDQLVDGVLQILRAALANVQRHARARLASFDARNAAGSQIVIAIDDDGLGFPSAATPPWSIASRVGDLGGEIKLVRDLPGAHLRIRLPQA
jgi:signal transduction histidine kinase